MVFGWVFASHMVGAGIAASYAGLVRQLSGEYFLAWVTARAASAYSPPGSAC